MKKFLVMLMVVAMASFLFVGCLPGVTPDVDEEEEEEEEVVEPTSATPVLTAVLESDGTTSIFTVTSTSTLYMNEDEVGTSILVKGTAPSESLVTIYIDDVAIVGAVGETATNGLWSVAIAASSLGDDGEKVMTAKVTEVGLAESEASNSVTFTLDTVDPGIDSTAATANAAAVTAVTGSTFVSGSVTSTNPLTSFALSATIPSVAIVAGSWTILMTADSAFSGNNMTITTSAGSTSYNVTGGQVFTNLIPGITFTLIANPVSGDGCTVTTTTATVTAVGAISARATITFDEVITHTGMAAGTYTIGGTAVVDPTTYRTATDTGYWAISGTLAEDSALTITVYGIEDAAGNIGGTSAVPLTKTVTVGAASATLLLP